MSVVLRPGHARSTRAVLGAALAAALVGAPAAVSAAEIYNFVPIAQNFAQDQTNFVSFASTGTGINKPGKVAFVGTLKNGTQGVFVGDGGVPTTIADTTGPIRSFFPAEAPSINDIDDVVFNVSRDVGGRAIIMASKDAVGDFQLTTVAETPEMEFVERPAINDNRTVVYVLSRIDPPFTLVEDVVAQPFGGSPLLLATTFGGV